MAALGKAQPATIVPVVQRPSAPGAFPGLYAGGFPDCPFLSDDVIVVNSQWYSQGVALAVRLSDGEVTPVTPVGPEHGSWAVQVRPGAAGGTVWLHGTGCWRCRLARAGLATN